MRRRKIAVLGGGVGSIAAAWQLARSGKDLDITVYQMGWRIGGKGASGRSRDPRLCARIEEHGLHMWSGLYDNAFRVMRECYAELGRPAGAKLAGAFDAFTPHGSIVLYEEWNGTWLPWEIKAPVNDERPGEPDARVSLRLWDYVGIALQLVFRAPCGGTAGFPAAALRVASTMVLAPVALLARSVWALLGALGLESAAGRLLLAPSCAFMFLFWCYARGRLGTTPVRRAWMLANFGFANVRGAVRDRVFERGLDPLDEINYVDWIARHMWDDRDALGGSGRSVTIHSPFARFLYDAQFSYLEGDTSRPDMGAGSALKTLLRMAFTWKGAILWRMEAGMGDVVFAPLYEALSRRGVRFEFFHQVKSVELDTAGASVERVRGLVQARAKAGRYEPLFDVKGLPCWPSEPDWDQLEGGEALRGTDFESYACTEGSPFELVAGRDFDELVFGFPVACVPHVAPQLPALHPKWRALLANLKLVRTQAFQMWVKEPKGTLGVAGEGEALAVTYAPTPLNTMSDMTFLVGKEDWNDASADGTPAGLYYFCGPLAGPSDAARKPSGAEMREEQARAERDTHSNVTILLGSLASPLFPDGTSPRRTPGAPFDSDVMLDPLDPARRGVGRLEAQYLRANTSPTELFTLTNTGSTKYRIAPGDEGVTNLWITGDWVDNTFNLSNVEASVMSGMLCANALCGYPSRESIVGLGFGSAKR